MWIITTKGVYSVVGHNVDKEQVLVRSRSERDIDFFYDKVVSMGLEDGVLSEKVYGEKFDYPWRYYMDRATASEVFGQLVDDISYSNFKSAASYRHNVFMDVYFDLMQLDDRPNTAAIGKKRSSWTPTSFTKQHDGERNDEDKERLSEDLLDRENGLIAIAEVLEGAAGPRTKRGKLKLIDALVRKSLWDEDIEGPIGDAADTLLGNGE